MWKESIMQDIEKYIASGILESYVLGFCSQQEAAEVEKLCQENPTFKAELEVVQKTLNQYALLHISEPKESTKVKIFAAIDKLESENELKQDPILDNSTIKQDAKVISLSKTAIPSYYIAAAIALFILSIATNIVLYKKWQNSEYELITLNSEKNAMAEKFNTNQVKFQEISNQLALLSNPTTQKVMLKAVEKHPGMLAMIYWNKHSKEVFLEIETLPMPKQGKQYQLWAIVDGKPIDAGMISMSPGDSSLHKMKDFESAQAFAITLENEGGSPSPDLSEMYVMGSIGS